MFKKAEIATLGFLLAANNADAEVLSGSWTNPATGQTAPSTIEVKSGKVIAYCTTTDKKYCWDMQVDRVYKNGALEVRQDAEHKNGDGSTIKFEHI